MIVVDTNVMVRLVVGGAVGTDADRQYNRDREWAAPGILISELRNVLLGLVRGGRATAEEANAMSEYASEVLGRRIISVTDAQVIDTALECGLTAYDAEFVVLARTLGVPLATWDSAILAGAPDVATNPASLSPA